jgi:hypothetical protein
LSGGGLAVLITAHVIGSGGGVLVAASFAVAVVAGVRVFGHVIAVGPAVASTVSENLGEALGTSLVVVAVIVVVAIAVVVVVVVGATVLCSGVVVVVARIRFLRVAISVSFVCSWVVKSAMALVSSFIVARSADIAVAMLARASRAASFSASWLGSVWRAALAPW